MVFQKYHFLPWQPGPPFKELGALHLHQIEAKLFSNT